MSRAGDEPALERFDDIIATALRIEPERRYRSGWRPRRSPRALTGRTAGTRDAVDLELPPASFIGRHRAATTGFLVAHIAAAIGLGWILWQAHEARVERDLAREQALRAEQVTSFLEELFAGAPPRFGGTERPRHPR